MLSLTRRPGESIHLHTANGLIKIILEPNSRNQIRLHIDAPRSVTILRAEIDLEDPEYVEKESHPMKSKKISGW
jgi:carbon storage regulator CsrA